MNVREQRLSRSEHRHELPWDYWIDGRIWPAIFALLAILLVLLAVTAPSRRQIGEAVADPSTGGALFAGIFLIVFGIAAITLGQAEAGWHNRLSWRESLLHLVARVAIVLLLTLPFWLVLFAVLSLEAARLPLVLGHLWLFGTVLALFGWWLALTGASDLVQFNVKYLAFFAFLFGSLFLPGLRLLNPFAALEYALWGTVPGSWSPLVAELLWLGLGGLLAAATRGRWRKFSLEWEWEELWKRST